MVIKSKDFLIQMETGTDIEKSRIEQVMDSTNNMIQQLRESFGIPEDWTIEESLKRVKEGVPGTIFLPTELIAAYVHLNRNEFSRYCAQIGRTTRQAKALLTDSYGMMWQLAKPCKRKPKAQRNKPSVKMKIAADWLCKFLLDKGKFAVPARTCLFAAHKQGIKLRTLQRAKDSLTIRCFRANHQWYWYLEDEYR